MHTSSSRTLFWSALIAFAFTASLPAYSQTASPGADKTVTCKDGSMSKSGRGACSHHGGIQKDTGANSSTSSAAPATSASPAPATSPSPTATSPKPATKSSTTSTGANDSGATAKCKDGTFSHSKHHTGTCSHHGGVAQWLDQK